MDCRRSLVWGLGLLTCALGCVSQQSTVPAGKVGPGATVRKESDQPKRTPKPETCLAYGKFREDDVADPKTAPAARQELLDQARQAYQQALKIDPAYVPAYVSLARVYLTLEDYPRALETYHKGLQKCPKSAELWCALGMCHARKKDWDAALTAFKKATELEPENRPYARTLGLCLARAGRNDESVACLAKVMPQAEAYLYVGRMLHHLQKDEDSKRYVRLALQTKPDLAPAREFLASLENPNGPPRALITVGFEEEAHPGR